MIAHTILRERPRVKRDNIYLPAEERQERDARVREIGCAMRTSRRAEQADVTYCVVHEVASWIGAEEEPRETKMFFRKSEARDMKES